jgi:hypothetical protein
MGMRILGNPIWLAAVFPAVCAGTCAIAEEPKQAAAPRHCAVTVERKYVDGAYQVWRQELGGGKCRCYIQTGKRPQSQTIERAIAGVLSDRQCTGAPVVLHIPGLPGRSSQPVRANALTN